MNCFECELCKSCGKRLKRLTQIKYYSTKINKLKRCPPKEGGHRLPHYIEKEIENVFVKEIEKKKIVQANYKNCIKCFVELNTDIYMENTKICRSCYTNNRSKKLRIWL